MNQKIPLIGPQTLIKSKDLRIYCSTAGNECSNIPFLFSLNSRYPSIFPMYLILHSSPLVLSGFPHLGLVF